MNGEAASRSWECDPPEAALRSFLNSVYQLPLPAVLELLRGDRRRPMTLRSLYVHSDFLDAVSSGGWTQEHAVLARRAARASRRLACELVPWRDRRMFAAALEAAALAVLIRSTRPTAVLEALVIRIESTWVRAVASV